MRQTVLCQSGRRASLFAALSAAQPSQSQSQAEAVGRRKEAMTICSCAIRNKTYLHDSADWVVCFTPGHMPDEWNADLGRVRCTLESDRLLRGSEITRRAITGSRPPHSITSSAIASTLGGIVKPNVLAVVRLITNSNFVGRRTGKSPGFSPFKTRLTYMPAWRYPSTKLMP